MLLVVEKVLMSVEVERHSDLFIVFMINLRFFSIFNKSAFLLGAAEALGFYSGSLSVHCMLVHTYFYMFPCKA